MKRRKLVLRESGDKYRELRIEELRLYLSNHKHHFKNDVNIDENSKNLVRAPLMLL